MRTVLASIESEYLRYERLGESAIRQLDDEQLVRVGGADSNSVATIAWHVSGNLRSRFTDFLTSDGEKPWRDRESEFARRSVSVSDVIAEWRVGWAVLFETLAQLGDADLSRAVRIRGIELSVVEALHRSLAHASFHVGQIVSIARSLRGADWKFLSIPPGESATYNANPTMEKSPGAIPPAR